MLTGQVFSIMAGTATEEQIRQITKSADRYLYDEKVGGYRLNRYGSKYGCGVAGGRCRRQAFGL